jgi:hypothetical protein
VQLVLLAHVGATLSAAHAAPVRALKQFKVPTANSEPRGTANGSDGNLWFTVGGENANVPSKIGRIPARRCHHRVRFGMRVLHRDRHHPGAERCLVLHVEQSHPGRITTSDEILDPIEIPNSNVVAGNLAVRRALTRSKIL